MPITVARLTLSPTQFADLVPVEKAALEALGFRYIACDLKKGEVPPADVARAEVIIGNTSYPLREKEIAHFSQLQLVIICNSGYDHVDTHLLDERNIAWLHLPQPRAIDVSETTIMMMLDMLRRSPWQYRQFTAGHWVRNQIENTSRLAGKTVGIVGFGHIGKRVATLLAPFQPEVVLAFDPFLDDAEFIAYPVQRCVSLIELVKTCDIVTLHCSLTPSSHQCINRDVLRHARQSLRLINTARGGVVALEAVCEALENGIMSAYAVDVFPEEPLAPDHWLRHHPAVYGTPHSAGYSRDMLFHLIDEEVRVLREWLAAY